MDKHTDNGVYLHVDGKIPWMHAAMDAHSNLAAFFVELTKFRKYAWTMMRVFVFERAMSLFV